MNSTTVTFTIAGLSLAPGAEFWIRWTDVDAAGADDGLALDNVSVQIARTTAVELSAFTADYFSDGVFVRWHSGYEAGNLGFNLYREEKGRRVLVNPSIIAGSAFFVNQTPMTAGDSYEWRDPDGSSDSVYYLDDLDIDGTITRHGPISPATGTPSLTASTGQAKRTEYRRALLLNELNVGRQKQTGAHSSQKGWATRRRPIAPKASASMLDEESSLIPAETPRLNWPETSWKSLATGATTNLTPLQQQKILASMPALKLGVRADGWYRATRSALVEAGLDPTADMRYLQLFADGVQVPIRINSSTDSGPLADGDSIEFYGVGLNSSSTDTQQYWLISALNEGNRLVAQSLKVSGPIGGLRTFNYTVERRERLIYFSGLLNGDKENFFGRVINNVPVSQTLSVRHLDPTDTESPLLEVALQGATLQDHAVKVVVNGTEVGTMNFSGFSNYVARFSLSVDVLLDGDNTVTLQRSEGISLVDYLRVSYGHTYEADNNQLEFSVRGRARIAGFTTPRIMLLDITNPNAVSLYRPRIEKAPGGFAISVNTSDTRTFLALTDQTALQPAAITRNEPSRRTSNAAGADMLIVTPANFRSSVEPLAQLRRSQGLSVLVVNVEDVYDEFSFGAHSPQAIRDLLQWANTNWTTPPRFVLLVGDGNYDPRNYLGSSEADLIPVRLIDTAVFETVSDDWFVDFDNDGVAEMAIGRLPARTVDEAHAMISKVVNYTPADTVQNVLMIADQQDTRTNFDFENATNELETLLPATLGVQKIFRGNDPATAVHEQILSAINQGPLVVNFIGHGSVEVWTGGPILSTTDAAAYQNSNRLPVFLMMTCLNAYFQNPMRESLAESLLRSKTGGAVAVWASSGTTNPEPQLEMGRSLYQQLFGAHPTTLGEAIRNAKLGMGDLDVSRTWILLGDPSMRIR